MTIEIGHLHMHLTQYFQSYTSQKGSVISDYNIEY